MKARVRRWIEGMALNPALGRLSFDFLLDFLLGFDFVFDLDFDFDFDFFLDLTIDLVLDVVLDLISVSFRFRFISVLDFSFDFCFEFVLDFRFRFDVVLDSTICAACCQSCGAREDATTFVFSASVQAIVARSLSPHAVIASLASRLGAIDCEPIQQYSSTAIQQYSNTVIH